MGIRNIDIIIALGLFVASSLSAIVTYRYITIGTTHSRILIESLPSHAQDYAIFHENNCIGDFTTTHASSDNNFEFSARGQIRVKLNDTKIHPKISAQVTFNSLGQLGASVFRIEFDRDFISIGSTEINPINVKMRLHINDHGSQHAFVLPGPLELKRNDSRSYRVEYHYLSQLISGGQRWMTQPIFTQVALEMRPISAGTVACRSDTSGVLNIDGFLRSFQDLFIKLNNNLPTSLLGGP